MQDVQTSLRQGRSRVKRRRVQSSYVEPQHDARTPSQACFNILLRAEVVEWQTRTFEGRVAQAVRVQVPPSAPNQACSYRRLFIDFSSSLSADKTFGVSWFPFT
ncbi:hypothetical protein NITMOv2_0176 [Nitrospira moscoviensis]|uniref:Uncharacterized protein n=1 Tax=Nitrospira moscoviensis TaxID=42253 RepID=A0A0K2G6L7_NITMO|nr:hypothetical protein NITMOv2_0176 [Nitrospira moscoviensis]